MAEVVMAALRAGDVVGGARDGCGAYGNFGHVAVIVSPFSIERIHEHAAIVFAFFRLTLVPVCVRAVLFH